MRAVRKSLQFWKPDEQTPEQVQAVKDREAAKKRELDEQRPERVQARKDQEAARKRTRSVTGKLVNARPPNRREPLKPVRLDTISWAPPDDGIVLCELFGGIGTGLEAALRAGLRIKRYVYCDIDREVRKIAENRRQHFLRRFSTQLTAHTFEGAFNTLPQNVLWIKPEHLGNLKQLDLLVAGSECQGFSRAGNKKGLEDPRSALILNLVEILTWAQETYPNVAFVLKNTHQDLWDKELSVDFLVVQFLVGKPFVIDAAQVGSFAHRLQNFWTNLAPLAKLELALHKTVREPGLEVNSILDSGRFSKEVLEGERVVYPNYEANTPGKPRSVLPTLVAFRDSPQFTKEGGRGSIYTQKTKRWGAPNADECERIMGFQTGTTAAPGVTEDDRCKALGRAIDLNTLVWILTQSFAFQELPGNDMNFDPDF